MVHPLDWSINSIYRKLTHNETWVFMSEVENALYLQYLKPKGKIILDIGASNGDSAKLFLDNGAKHVICIEINKNLAEKIRLPNTTVHIEPFKLEHLSIPHDCMKIDIEGGEKVLLDYDKPLKPTIAEVHDRKLVERFKINGWKVVSYNGSLDCAIMINDAMKKAEL